MFDHVVDGLFEDEKYLAANISAELDIFVLHGCAKIQLHVSRCQDVRSEAPHSLIQIAEVVLLWIDGPDNIAHSVDQFSRRVGNRRQRGCVFARPILSHFAHDRNLGQARANVIVQIGGDALPDSFQFAKALFSRPL